MIPIDVKLRVQSDPNISLDTESVSVSLTRWGNIIGDIDDQTDLITLVDNYVPKTTTVNGHALSDNVTVTKADVGLGDTENGAEINVIDTVEVNGTPLTVTDKTVDITVPTKTSDLTNDSNYVSDASYVHTDNNFTTSLKNKLDGIENGAEVNVQADWDQSDSDAEDYIKNKPALAAVATSGDYDDLIDKPSIPTKTSDLTNDGSDGTSTYVEADELATVATSGSYSDLSNKPSIPTKTSDLTNDGSDGTSTYTEADGTYPDMTVGNAKDIAEDPPVAADFNYRQITDGHKGKAKIVDIKGNTVSFNQLVHNGNFDSASNWAGIRGSISVSNNELTYTITQVGSQAMQNRLVAQQVKTITGHKYFLSINVLCKANNELSFQQTDTDTSLTSLGNPVANTWSKLSGIMTATANTNDLWISMNATSGYSVGDTIKCKICMLFDLTLMGIDNLTTTAEVEEWLSSHIGNLPYYDYTQGTLIPFNGTGLKTVRFNQWDEEWEIGEISITNGENVSGSNIIRSKNYIPILPNMVYYFKTGNTAVNTYRHFYDADKNYLGYVLANTNSELTTPANAYYMRFRLGTAYGTTYNNDICINISDAEKNGTYEPYISNTLSLPTLTYFPTGMKSAGSVYDELSDKAYTRVGSVNLGSIDWTHRSFTLSGTTYHYFESSPIDDIKTISLQTELIGMICGRYIVCSQSIWVNKTPCIFKQTDNTKVVVADNNFTDENTFKQAMADQNVKLYYELATPTETDISPSLDLTYPIENGGTEQILPVNSSVPTTTEFIGNIEYPSNVQIQLNALENITNILAGNLAKIEPEHSTSNYSVNDYLVYNNQLYKVTSAITTGEQLIVGTNITATTVMAEIIARL